MFPTPQGSDEWKALRQTFLTCTDAGTLILGNRIDQFSLYQSKIFGPKPIPARLQALFEWGHRHEPDAASLVEAFVGLTGPCAQIETGLLMHGNGWLSASLDRLIRIETEKGPYMFVLEIKTTHKAPDHPKPAHLIQVQGQLEVVLSPPMRTVLETSFNASILPFALLVYYTPYNPSPPFRLFRVDRDPVFPYAGLKPHAEALEDGRRLRGPEVPEDPYRETINRFLDAGVERARIRARIGMEHV